MEFSFSSHLTVLLLLNLVLNLTFSLLLITPSNPCASTSDSTIDYCWRCIKVLLLWWIDCASNC